MSFLQIDVGNGFIATMINVIEYISMIIIFGMALNIEHYQDKVRKLKIEMKMNEGLNRLQDIELEYL